MYRLQTKENSDTIKIQNMWQGDQKMRADLEQILNSELPLALEYDETYDKVDISELEEPCRQGIPTAIYELAARFHVGVDGAEKIL